MIFIDCGTNFGQGLEKILSLNSHLDIKTVYSFEANPITFKEFIKSGKDDELRTLFPEIDFNFFNNGVYHLYGLGKINCEIDTSSQKHTGGGSSLLSLDEWNTESVYGWESGSRYQKYVEKPVICVNIGDIINSIDSKEDLIIKLDIEGVETEALESISHWDLLGRVKKMYIEFHDNVLPGKSSDFSNAIQKITEANIDLTIWH